MLKVKNLVKHFPIRQSFVKTMLTGEKKVVHAVNNISFNIEERQTLGLVGESGSGKTTTGRLVLRLIEPTAGSIVYRGMDITALKKEPLRKLRKEIQIIFQDPLAALNPYMKVGDAVRHPLDIHGIGNREERHDMVLDMLSRVNLEPASDFVKRYPRELSGGQRQRVVIARALITRPKFVVADEAVAMLDVSVRSQLLDLMLKLKEEFNLTYLFITHDLATTKYICDRIAVMYLGTIVETGSFEEIYKDPAHPYTKALISAVPEPDPETKKKKMIPAGEVPNAVDLPSGCFFHPRCPFAMDKCKVEEPPEIELSETRMVKCHLFDR
ncbi:MAG: oligopeptide ABC transporter ATP-binding protein [Thermotogae bacterium]|uniref:ABC transporter ATP-binding protein n=1 Tax=Kosmotoga sp. TaxID=1955248 RepID=UPI000F1EF41D|nr:ABC transporter ATP-binding protein [Kosmotoga sp.]MBO8166637.1 ABC transporter ATP-binding protein [Kosmotoga sp.]RKX49163.1 MAG: oligopeptide ABC transporter ATP-binding protein [Thermotogota bacterium]